MFGCKTMTTKRYFFSNILTGDRYALEGPCDPAQNYTFTEKCIRVEDLLGKHLSLVKKHASGSNVLGVAEQLQHMSSVVIGVVNIKYSVYMTCGGYVEKFANEYGMVFLVFGPVTGLQGIVARKRINGPTWEPTWKFP